MCDLSRREILIGTLALFGAVRDVNFGLSFLAFNDVFSRLILSTCDFQGVLKKFYQIKFFLFLAGKTAILRKVKCE